MFGICFNAVGLGSVHIGPVKLMQNAYLRVIRLAKQFVLTEFDPTRLQCNVLRI